MKLFYSSQSGRSMIEMLGVLAIVGILSVGGISGFSTAMTKYRLIKFKETYAYVIQNVLQYEEEWKKERRRANYTGGQYAIAYAVAAVGLLPENWKQNGQYIYDDFGGRHYMAATADGCIEFQYAMRYSKNSNNNADNQRCVVLMSDILQQMDGVKKVELWAGNTWYARILGCAECSKSKEPCLCDLTINQIYEFCTICAKNAVSCSFRYLF